MPDNPLTVEDFAATIKQKMPEYAEADDYDLAHRIIKKYPDYAQSVNFGPRERAYAAAARASLPRDVADDFLHVTGGIESGNRHRTKGGQVLQSAPDPKTGERAVGFSQIKPSTIKPYGLDPYDEDQNIEGGLRYFSEGGSDPVARRIHYFGGPGALKRYKKTGRIPSGGDVTGTTFKKYVNVTMPKISPVGDAPRYGVAENPISNETQNQAMEPVSPEGGYNITNERVIPPEMTADPNARRQRQVYETPLTSEEESKFQAWKQTHAPNDNGIDYDLRGAFKAGAQPDAKTGHWPDTFKKPNHPTFSVESQYATGLNKARAGTWKGDEFQPPKPAPPEDEPIGSLGEIRAKGPDYEAKFYNFVHRNAPAGTKATTAGKAADQNLAKVFLQLNDFMDKNPNASPKDVNRGFAQIGAEFLKDPATRGAQLPRALHEAMLSAEYTPEEWAQIPGKLQGQIKQAAAQRSAQKAQQVAQQKFAKFAKGRDIASDIQWHFGDEGLERFEQLKKRDQQEMISIALAAAFKDEAKKGAGVELTQDPEYQAEMRGRLPALAKLEGQPPPGVNSDPFALLKSINAQPAPPSRDDSLREQAVRNTESFTADPVANIKFLYGAATKGVKAQFDAEAETEFQNLKAAEKRAVTPEMISARKFYGSLVAVEGQPNPRAFIQPLARTAAGLMKLAAGTYDFGGLFPESDVSKYVRTKAQFIEEAASLPPLNAAEEEVKRGLPEKTVAALMDTGLSIAEIIALKKLSGIKSLSRLLALETALKTTGEPAAKRATQIIESATMGKVLDKHLSRPASALLFGGPTAARQGQSYLAGDASLEDAILQTAVQTGVGFALGGKPGETKDGAVKEAESATVKVQSEGRSADTAHQGRTDGGGLERGGGDQSGLRSRSKPAEKPVAEEVVIPPKDEALPRSEDVAPISRVASVQAKLEDMGPGEFGKTEPVRLAAIADTKAELDKARTAEENPLVREGEKQPWEMSDSEIKDAIKNEFSYLNFKKNGTDILADYDKYGMVGAERKWAVEGALKRGENVPATEIAKYPELAAQPSPKVEAQTQNQESMKPEAAFPGGKTVDEIAKTQTSVEPPATTAKAEAPKDTETPARQLVAERIKNAPSYPALRQAALRFAKSFLPKGELVNEEYIAQQDAEPWKYLTKHSGVLSAKSARAETLRTLARKVIAESGVPTHPRGTYRGDSERINWTKAEAMLPQPQPSEGASPKGDKGGSVGSRAPLNPVQPVTPPPAKPPKGATPPKPPAGPTLEEARRITRAPEPTRSVKDFVKSIPSWLQTNFTSEFTPLRDLERLVRKAAGKNAPDFDMARRFETLAGAGAKAEADLIEFKGEVLAPVKHIADEFNDFLFLKRAEDRLTKDPDRKKVGTWDVAKVQKGLDELKAEVTPAEYAKLEQAGKVYQQHMQRALYLQVESGRMTQGLYDKIIKENDFYAPYKLLKYLEETASSPGTGRQIASIQDVTKAITGIDVDDFGLRNLLQASAEQITRSRILAEKNTKMLALADLADVDAQSQSPTELIKHAKLTSYYPIDYKPAEEILHQLRLQETARNPQLLEQQMVKVGKAIEFAEQSGISIGQKNLPTSLGRAIIGQIKGGRISLKAFTSEVVSHEIGHSFDEATGVIRKKVFGTMRDVTQRHSSEINSQRIFQKELKDLTQFTQLGGGKKYQSSAKERYAEFISLYIHDPMKARQLAPTWTDFFEKNILPRAKVQRVVSSLADFFQKVDALPNIKSELQGLDNHNYLELAIRRAFPEKATQLGVTFGDKPGMGNEIIPYFKNGKAAGLEVSKEVAQAIQGLNAPQASVISKVLMAGRTPLQFGATSANLGFQVVNYVSADQARTLITSRYGLRLGPTQTPIDMIRYPLDAVYSLYTSMAGNVFGKHNALFMDWLKSGAANSTIQRELTPEAFKQTLGIENKTTAQKVRGSGRFVLDTVAKISNAVEEATKITTLKRGLRFEGADKMTPENRQAVIDERITPEVRNYGGSPDFARHGAQMRQMNLLMMFLNARVQGTTSDLSRLALQTGSKEGAAAWGRMSVMVGLPTTLLALVNTMPGYRDDYDKVPGWEKNAYWMIPRESFFTDEETGEPVRDYWRIPKRDIFQLYSNLIENGVLFARDKSPEAAGKLATDMIENLSPVNIEGANLKERAESAIGSANPIIKMPIEIGLNRDTFRHRPIVPQYMKDASSEKQYRASTPKPYVRAGETPVAKALGMSPLEIEHVARGATGDALGQFALRPAEAGRGDWTGYPVVRRFVRSGAVEPDIKSSEALQQAEQHQADTKIDRRREAYEMIRRWDKAKLSPSEREAQIKATAKTDAALADDLIRYSESRILTSTERRLRLLGIENGERAQFLVDEIERTPEEKRDAYVARLKALNIITKSVASQMSRIRAGKVSKGKTKSIRTRLRNFSKMERQAGRYNVTAQ